MIKLIFNRTNKLENITPIPVTSNLNGTLQVAADQLKAFVEQMNISVNDLKEASNSSTESVIDLKAHSEKTNEYTTQVSEKMKSIEASAVNVSQFTDSIYLDSQSSYQDLVLSWNALKQLQTDMEILYKTHFILIDQMERLVNHSKKIDEIIYTIGSISQKTRILALNASIEAARAGVHGNGFAVVANEFENLSKQTSKAVEDTRQNIQLIQEEVSSTTDQVKEETTLVETGSEQLNSVLNKMESFKTKLGHINEMVSDSSLAVNEQTASVQEIAAYLEEISNMSIENKNHVEQVLLHLTTQHTSINDLLSISNSLTNTSEELQKIIPTEPTEMMNLFVDQPLLNKIKDSLSKLASLQEIKEMIPKQHELLLNQYVTSNPELEAIWSNRSDGTFIFSNPPAGLANAKVRPWFREAMSGNTFVSQVYTSALTKNPCLTISLPIFNERQVIGVIGVDLSLKK